MAWQKAQDLAVRIYRVTNANNDFGFNNQIRRASVSISNNIAEGYNRNTRPEFRRFLYFASGSTSEVKSMAYLGARLEHFTKIERDDTLCACTEISRIIYGLIKSLNHEKVN